MTWAAFCPNCGTAQLPGSEFCVQCGVAQKVAPTSNAATAAAPPAAPVPPTQPAEPAPPAPPPSPTAPASPPVAAAAVPTAAPAFSLPQLIAAVVGASIGVGALAIAITLVLSRGGGGPADDGQASGGNVQVVDVQNIRLEVPKDWDVLTRAGDTIRVDDPANRLLSLRSALLPTTLSLDEIQTRFLDRTRDQSPDARVCLGPETAALPGGPRDGRYFVVCSTLVPQGGGPAVQLADAYYVALWGGATVSVLQLTAVPNELEAFATEVRALAPPVWKLHR